MTDGRADLCFLAVDPARADRGRVHRAVRRDRGRVRRPRDSAARRRRRRRPPRRAGRGQAGLGLRPVPHPDAAARDRRPRRARASTCSASRAWRSGAGIRQPVTAYAAAHPDVRVVDERFMQIQQAVGTPVDRAPGDRRVPARPRRGAQGQRLRRRLARPLRAGGRDAVAPPGLTRPRAPSSERVASPVGHGRGAQAWCEEADVAESVDGPALTRSRGADRRSARALSRPPEPLPSSRRNFSISVSEVRSSRRNCRWSPVGWRHVSRSAPPRWPGRRRGVVGPVGDARCGRRCR